MKKILKKFINDIFIIEILIAMVLVFVVRWSQDIRLGLDRVFLALLGTISIIYHWKCFKNRNIDLSLSYNKFVLITREIISAFATILLYIAIVKLWPDFLPNIPKKIADLDKIWLPVLYLITFKLQFSLLAIAVGIKLSTMLLSFLLFVPVLIIIGGFDIRYWAAVTGLLGIWNYLNSKDFILYIRKGKSISSIPSGLEFKWQRNKLFATLGTVIFYCSLVVSSFFEHEKMSWMDRINPRLYSILGLTVFLALSYSFVLIYYLTLNSRFEKNFFMKLILWCGEKLRLNKLERTIDLYKLAKNKK